MMVEVAIPPPRPVFVRRVRPRPPRIQLLYAGRIMPGNGVIAYCRDRGSRGGLLGRAERRFAFNACPTQLTQPRPKTLTGLSRLAGISSRAIQASLQRVADARC
jgi:hypothetical protein